MRRVILLSIAAAAIALLGALVGRDGAAALRSAQRHCLVGTLAPWPDYHGA